MREREASKELYKYFMCKREERLAFAKRRAMLFAAYRNIYMGVKASCTCTYIYIHRVYRELMQILRKV